MNPNLCTECGSARTYIKKDHRTLTKRCCTDCGKLFYTRKEDKENSTHHFTCSNCGNKHVRYIKTEGSMKMYKCQMCDFALYVPISHFADFEEIPFFEPVSKGEKEMKREKTDSLTHLTKIIAREEFEKMFKEKKKELAVNINMKHEIVDDNEILKTLTSTLAKPKNAYEKWDAVEDTLLEEELRIAFRQIAKNHGRTPGAIKSRIRQKDLMDSRNLEL